MRHAGVLVERCRDTRCFESFGIGPPLVAKRVEFGGDDEGRADGDSAGDI